MNIPLSHVCAARMLLLPLPAHRLILIVGPIFGPQSGRIFDREERGKIDRFLRPNQRVSSGSVSYLNLGTEEKIKITICRGPSGPDREVIKKLRLSILMDVISAGCERARDVGTLLQ